MKNNSSTFIIYVDGSNSSAITNSGTTSSADNLLNKLDNYKIIYNIKNNYLEKPIIARDKDKEHIPTARV